MAKRSTGTRPKNSKVQKNRIGGGEKTDDIKSASHHSALDDIDRLFHEKARLGIMTTLIGREDGLGFNELKSLCDLTDGNLNRHLKVLVENKMLSVKKSGQGRSTHSQYRLTAKGRSAFTKYLDALEQVLLAAQAAAQSTATKAAKQTVSKAKGRSPSENLGLEM